MVKGTHCLGSDELVSKKRLKPFVIKRVLKVEYNDPHKLASKLRGYTFALRKFYSHKWTGRVSRKVKGKPRNFEAYLCGSLYSTSKTSFQPYAFYNKWLQTLFTDQLDWSNATCSFKFKCHDWDSNPHSADQKCQSLSLLCWTTSVNTRT